jgi:hypothetical protein
MKIGEKYQLTRKVVKDANATSASNGIESLESLTINLNLFLPAIRAMGTACLEIASALEKQTQINRAMPRANGNHPIRASINPLTFIDDDDDGPTKAA